MLYLKLLGVLALLISTIIAQTAIYCPGDNVCYVVNVPAVTASTGLGDIYFQITGPSSMSWIALGQGTSMTGANIFVVYPNAAGTNLTVSHRLGVGEQEPTTSIGRVFETNVTLLEGSGISNGLMTANIRCSNCSLWAGGSMSYTDTSSAWIWSYLVGPPIASDRVDARLQQHSQFGTTSFNLPAATGGNGSNPFIAANATPESNMTTVSTGTSQPSPAMVRKYNMVLMTHAILAPVAFVLLFPTGAIGIRVLRFTGLVYVHAGWMTFALAIAIVAMGLGIWLADAGNQLKSSHAIIGLVVVGSLVMQPITGLMHHILFKRHGSGPNTFTFLHLFWGRAMITLGIINGGLGLRLSDNSKSGKIAYGIVAGVMWVAWMASIVVSMMKKRATVAASDSGEELANIRSKGEAEGVLHEHTVPSQQSSPRHYTADRHQQASFDCLML
ncbi:integral membrane protein [Phlyctema vagabunda]|uniref:Integral membrane protein n=1 Tax=Phlyctema vagabunda TaxID=108571 RepID=A0ABR4PQS8_9HELO